MAAPKIPKKLQKHLKSALNIAILLAWVFISIVASQILVGGVMYSILGEDLYANNLWSTVYIAISYALSCFLVIFIPSRAKKAKLSTSRAELGLTGLPEWRDVALAVSGFFVYVVAAALFLALFGLIFSWFDASEAQNIGYSQLTDIGGRILAFVSLIIVAPIAEETIFRGWLYAKIRRYVPIWVATLLVSVLFAAVHSPLSAALNAFTLSVIMCLLRELTGTTYSSILLHIVKNAIAVTLLLQTGAL